MVNLLLNTIIYEFKLAITKARMLSIASLFLISITIFAVLTYDVVQQNALSIIFVLTFLSLQFATQYFFEEEYNNGIVEQILLQGRGLEMILIAKIIAHWLCYGLLVVGLTPIAMIITRLDMSLVFTVLLVLMFSTLILACFNAIGAALVLGQCRTTLLTPILIMPLTIPILILCISAITYENTNELIALGLSLLTIIPISVIATANILKNAVNYS